MAQILDTRVDSNGVYILDTQEFSNPTGYIITTVGGATANGVTARALYPLIIPTTVGGGTANGITASITRGFSITTTPAQGVAGGNTATISGSIYTEYFSTKIRNKNTGSPITGLTNVTLTIYKPSSGLILDFFDGVFKTSPSIGSAIMNEVSSTNNPGLYNYSTTISGWDGWINWEITYNDGSYTYSYTGERYYISNVRSDGVPTSPSAVSSAVWDHPVTAAVLPDTMGVWLYNRVLTVGKFLGLK